VNKEKERGFTLIELSIVIVIVGLIAAAVLSVTSLIRSSQLQGVISDIQKFKTIIQAFELQYSALPGDIYDAKEYWPDDSRFFGFITENGNGDKKIEGYEELRFWQHLSLAGMVKKDFSGVLEGLKVTIGKNVPDSPFTGGGYYMAYRDNLNDRSGNAMDFAAEDIYGKLKAGVLSGKDAYIIDNKIDDGAPATGSVMGNNGVDIYNCIKTSSTPSIYDRSFEKVGCNLTFWMEK